MAGRRAGAADLYQAVRTFDASADGAGVVTAGDLVLGSNPLVISHAEQSTPAVLVLQHDLGLPASSSLSPRTWLVP
jgi:hypothetical protein